MIDESIPLCDETIYIERYYLATTRLVDTVSLSFLKTVELLYMEQS